jgi:NAD(P)-dependent dehydrogenase (short-subunit alcohol dehydrogenase family)
MSPVEGGPVVVVGGGSRPPGRAVTAALLAGGARVIVPVRTEEEAERFYLEADPATVPRLRAAVGACDDPALPDRIAAVARREFGGVDHVVSVLLPPALGPLDRLGAREVGLAVEEGLAAPAALLLGMLRHLSDRLPVRRVVAVTPASADPGHPPDAGALARTFLDGLFALLRAGGRPGLEFHTLALPSGADEAALGRGIARLLSGGVSGAPAPDDIY